MAEENKTYLTEEGLKKLQDEYYNLVHVVREEVKQELACLLYTSPSPRDAQ